MFLHLFCVEVPFIIKAIPAVIKYIDHIQWFIIIYTVFTLFQHIEDVSLLIIDFNVCYSVVPSFDNPLSIVFISAHYLNVFRIISS